MDGDPDHTGCVCSVWGFLPIRVRTSPDAPTCPSEVRKGRAENGLSPFWNGCPEVQSLLANAYAKDSGLQEPEVGQGSLLGRCLCAEPRSRSGPGACSGSGGSGRTRRRKRDGPQSRWITFPILYRPAPKLLSEAVTYFSYFNISRTRLMKMYYFHFRFLHCKTINN